jgi:DNA gyrase subunit A
MPDNETPAPPTPPPPSDPNAGKNVLPVNIEDEMRKSYLDYSMSVIVGRALPDARDGLKPVHRRVLYAMNELGNLHNRPYKKSARIVGDVIGKYHPHGDIAVYDALVRMAQDFSLRYPLVDGQGNFGSLDDDPAAAMRYTEARLTQLAEELLADIDKETVDFGPNYDDSTVEPLVMPARFPNLLVNGADGIAVGMSTKIPPHNLGEAVDAAIFLIDNPKCTVADLMKIVPGPDFPTAATVSGRYKDVSGKERDGIREAYETGRGLMKVRAVAEIETEKKTERERIVVTEIPYQVNKARMIEHIAFLANEKRIEGVSDVRDESDRHGIRVVIELKRDAVTSVVLNNLYAHTDMQVTFGVIMLAIDAGQPRLLNLRDVLDRFVSHRRDVVTRRSRFELKKAEARLHIVEGLIVAQDFIDTVIALIRKSKDGDEARFGLMHLLSPALSSKPAFKDLPRIDAAKAKTQLDALVARLKNDEKLYPGLTRTYVGTGFSKEQADAILDMRLQKLTGLEREELVKELLELTRQIARLKEILAEEKVLLDVIKSELREIREKYADKRRTRIVDVATAAYSAEDLIKDEDMVVTVSYAGYVKRNSPSLYRAQKRGGRGKTGAGTREDDFVREIFVASTHSYMLVLTNRGRVYWLKVHEIPQAGRSARGKAIVNLLPFKPDEKLAAILPVKTFEAGKFVLFVTRKGLVKKTTLEEYSNPRPSGIIALSIEEGDDLVAALLTDGSKDVLLATKEGMSIRFKEDEVRPMGRTAYGVKGMSLEGNDEVVEGDIVEPGATILTVCERGYGKRSDEAEYRIQGRGGKGIIDIKVTEKNGPVIGTAQVRDDDQVMIITNKGMLIRTKVKEISVIGRNTQGVRLLRLEDAAEKVVSVAKLAESEGDVEGGDDGGSASKDGDGDPAEGGDDGAEGNET